MNTFFVGLDWASRTHALCVIDEQGSVREQLEIVHDADGLALLQRRLRHWHCPPIAIERPSGLLVDTLVEAGFTVVPIHPNVVKATRPRYRSHGAKSDASDAYLLADLLRTDGHRFAALAPQSDEIRALRALVRGRDDLVATRVQLANQLRSLLESFWPGAAEVFAVVDSPIALAFIERYPSPESASRLGPKRMAAFCAQHAYCGRRSVEELLGRLHQAPAAVCAELEADAKGELARVSGAGSVRSCAHQQYAPKRLAVGAFDRHFHSRNDRVGRRCRASGRILRDVRVDPAAVRRPRPHVQRAHIGEQPC